MTADNDVRDAVAAATREVIERERAKARQLGCTTATFPLGGAMVRDRVVEKRPDLFKRPLVREISAAMRDAGAVQRTPPRSGGMGSWYVFLDGPGPVAEFSAWMADQGYSRGTILNSLAVVRQLVAAIPEGPFPPSADAACDLLGGCSHSFRPAKHCIRQPLRRFYEFLATCQGIEVRP